MSVDKNTNRYHIIVALLTIIVFLLFGTVMFSILEGWTLAESFYFSAATLTTVGYGDLHPTTDLSRLVASFYLLFGVGATLSAITVLATDRINKTAGRIKKYASNKNEEKESN
jgi:cytochrome bd-type quinol oxidase subunit 2